MFVKNYVVNIGSFHIAPIQSNGVIERKIKHKHIQKESTFALPLITSLGDPLGGLPLETIQHLATHAEVWQAIPGVSNWVLGIIKRGYTLQFARRPPQFGGEVSTSVQHSNAHVLRAEVMSLQAKMSRGNGFPNSELLQPLLPRPQEGWWSKTHFGSEAPLWKGRSDWLHRSRSSIAYHHPDMGSAHSVEPSFWAATVCWPLSPDAEDRSATSTSIDKTYGRSAGAISQPLLPQILRSLDFRLHT